MSLETIVIVDGLNLLNAATAAAEAARPTDKLEYSIYGLAECKDVPNGKGGLRHVHWFSGDAAVMKGGMDKRRKYDVFGGFLYATRRPDHPAVRAHCAGLAALAPDAKPMILKL